METKYVAGLVAAGVLLSGVAGAVVGDLADNSEDKILELQSKVVEAQTKYAELEAIEPEVIVDTKIVTVNNTVEVEVDNGNLEMVLDHVQENCEADFCDVDDDETELIVENIAFEIDALNLAENAVDAEGIEYMDDENLFNTGLLDNFRDDDVSYIRIDSDDTNVTVTDYEDKEATVLVEARIKVVDGDDKKVVDAVFEVDVDKDDAEIVDVTLSE